MKKIISYIGFAIKAKKVVAGQSRLKHCKEPLTLIMVGQDATENLIHLAENIAKKHGCPLIKSKCNLEDLTHMAGIKIIALTDENLSKAIINEKEKITIG